jgi:hypothetical protein
MLLTAALSAAGLITSFAQGTVYSVNVVGYINLTLGSGYSLVANQLDNLKGNLVAEVIPTAPNNTTVYKLTPSGAGYDQTAFVDGAWDEAAMTIGLNPGEGCFVFIDPAFATPGGDTLTFVGEVRQSATGLVTTTRKGFQIVSSQVPQAGNLQTDLGYAPNESDTVYLWNPTSKSYAQQAFIDGAWGGDFGDFVEPPIKVGEAFFLSVVTDTPTPWTRIFEIK